MKNLLSALLAFFASAAHGKEPRILTGQASFYARTYVGKTMANGKPYNPRAFTLACDDLPLGTLVYITYTTRGGNKRNAHAEVTDRGPTQQLRNQGRIFDLSWALFNHLENPAQGVIKITVQVCDGQTKSD